MNSKRTRLLYFPKCGLPDICIFTIYGKKDALYYVYKNYVLLPRKIVQGYP